MLKGPRHSSLDRHWVLERTALERAIHDPLFGGLVAAHAGTFHRAPLHRVHRPGGFNSHQISFCLKGRGTLHQGGKKQAIHSGQMFLTSMYEPHQYYSETESPWHLAFIHFAGVSADAFLRRWGFHPQSAVFTPPETLFRALLLRQRQIERIYTRGGPLAHLEGSCELRRLLLDLTKELAPRGAPSPFARVLSLMENRIGGALSLTRMAKESGMGLSVFRREFHAEFGKGAVAYFLDLKAQAALAHLARGQTVAQCARSLGYDNPNYFSRFLSKRLGRTAREIKAGMEGKRTPRTRHGRQADG